MQSEVFFRSIFRFGAYWTETSLTAVDVIIAVEWDG